MFKDENKEHDEWENSIEGIHYRISIIGENVLGDEKYIGLVIKTLLKTPEETEEIKAGDCEDLTALLNSYLESIGIKTYLVFTKGHIFSLVCNIDIKSEEKQVIRYWTLNDQKCYPLDATAGKEGYIGMLMLNDQNYSANDYELYAVDTRDYSIYRLKV